MEKEKLTPAEWQKVEWLLDEMGFRWDKRRQAFINDERNGARVPLEWIKMRVSYGTFQRSVQDAIDRAVERYKRTRVRARKAR